MAAGRCARKSGRRGHHPQGSIHRFSRGTEKRLSTSKESRKSCWGRECSPSTSSHLRQRSGGLRIRPSLGCEKFLKPIDFRGLNGVAACPSSESKILSPSSRASLAFLPAKKRKRASSRFPARRSAK